LVRVVIGRAGVALLELPEDMVALDEVEYEYHLTSRGIVCGRGRRGRCRQVATYEASI
jgi:hypothetical protein